MRLAPSSALVALLLMAADWRMLPIDTKASFRGIAVVSDRVVWISGTAGTVARTTDGGASWTVMTVPGAEKLDFRDIEAFGDKTAYALAAGPGEDSRIYKTTDAGKTWTEQFKNTDKDAFYDAISFWDEDNGLAFGDPVKGKFQILKTDDGGKTWSMLKSLPASLPNEGAFAASGTCLVCRGRRDAWFITGGAAKARVFHSNDRGVTWTSQELPLPADVASAGAYSIAFRDDSTAMIVGGDYKKPSEKYVAAVTHDGGKTWKATTGKLPYCSSIHWTGKQWLAAGTDGISKSDNDGQSWTAVSGGPWNALRGQFVVGPKGRVARLEK